jgi:hypothetical protein
MTTMADTAIDGSRPFCRYLAIMALLLADLPSDDLDGEPDGHGRQPRHRPLRCQGADTRSSV